MMNSIVPKLGRLYPILSQQHSRTPGQQSSVETVPSCQQLLQMEPSYSGYLKRKEKVLTIKHWNKSYVIIHHGVLHVYPGANARKPVLTCSLFGYDRVEQSSSQTYSWVFNLRPLVSCLPVLTFAAASKPELTRWLLELRVALLQAHNKPSYEARQLANRAHGSDTGLDRGDMESNGMFQESVYSDLEEREKVSQRIATMGVEQLIDFSASDSPVYQDESQLSTERISLFETPDDNNFRSTNTYQDESEFLSNRVSLFETPVPISVSNAEDVYAQAIPRSQREKEVEEETDDGESYYNAALFCGSREEASVEILRRTGDGVFLVRQHSGRQVLTVLCAPSLIVKYELGTKCDGTIHIAMEGHPQSFESLPHLLHHYHLNNLPNRDLVLCIPYSLADHVK